MKSLIIGVTLLISLNVMAGSSPETWQCRNEFYRNYDFQKEFKKKLQKNVKRMIRRASRDKKFKVLNRSIDISEPRIVFHTNSYFRGLEVFVDDYFEINIEFETRDGTRVIIKADDKFDIDYRYRTTDKMGNKLDKIECAVYTYRSATFKNANNLDYDIASEYFFDSSKEGVNYSVSN